MISTVPRVMVSSTFYDLKQIRANLQKFLKEDLGYSPLLFEYTEFSVDPDSTAIENCKRIVENADILVLIIGGQYGSVDRDSGKSVTNIEYIAARSKGIPIYPFVEKTVFSLLPMWQQDPNANFSKHVKDVRVFHFINEICSKDKSWIFTFENAEDIIRTLKNQFAYLMREGLQSADRIKKQGFSIDEVRKFLEIIENKRGYKKWKFRINWPLADTHPKIDAYSDEIDYIRLLGALLLGSEPIGKREIASVFDALIRVVQSNSKPPKKLSGVILFSDFSNSAQDSVQRHLGSRPYERLKDRQPAWEDTLQDQPNAIILPIAYLSENENYKNYVSAQRRIVRTASLICKYVLCSSYQISISHSLKLRSNDNEKVEFAVACTARNTNKESLAVVSEIPVLMSGGAERILWYGQLHRRPTSEYLSHWAYHKRTFVENFNYTLIVHFHPVELLELYEESKNYFRNINISEDFWKCAEKFAKKKNLILKVFTDYINISARDPRFGEFMAEVVKQTIGEQSSYLIVWKPDHGVWLLTDPMLAERDKDMLDILSKVEKLAVNLSKQLIELYKRRKKVSEKRTDHKSSKKRGSKEKGTTQ